nr:hypothetical protein BCR59_28070 [Klebsiella pneumoniae]
MEEPVWLFPRQMPQLAPLFSRRALATSRDEKVVTTLDAGLQRQLEDLALNWKSRLPPRSSLAMVDGGASMAVSAPDAAAGAAFFTPGAGDQS